MNLPESITRSYEHQKHVENAEQGRVSEFVALASSATAYPARDARVVAEMSALTHLKKV